MIPLPLLPGSALPLQVVVLDPPAAPSFEQTLLVAAASLVAGYGISLFRNRLLPWTTLTGFSEQIANHDVVAIPEDLSIVSAQTWFTRPINNETDRLGNVQLAFRVSEAFLNTNKDSRAAIQTAIDRMREATSEADKIAALYVAAGHEGIVGLLGAAISRTAIVVPPHNPDLPQVLPYQLFRNHADGCFGLDFPDELVPIGADLNNDYIFGNRLVPAIESMSRLDTSRLIPMFEALLPIMQSHMDLHRVVVEKAKPIVEPKTRWAAHIIVSNYGSTPFLLFDRKGWIVIEAHDMDPFLLPTKLVYLPEGEREQDIAGAHLVEAGKTDRFILLTTATQSEIPRGDRLRALWKSGDAKGRAGFHVRGRELPIALRSRTSWVQFKEQESD